ncbi:MAG TPA: flagellar hook-basal body complex protein FliE [Burkholderiaceae bacterium]|nr:flagellar hook-basal body complex protein FliE [Burkholderiaceae bacterium]
MSSSSISSIESLLSQMRHVADAAAGLPAKAPVAKADAPGTFAAELSRTLERVSVAQNQAAAQAQAFQAGEPGVNLTDVMIDLQTAGLAFQTTLQVRNRLIAAYQEIASMPV